MPTSLEKPYADFVTAMRQRESGGNYRAKNAYGFLGAYQFGMMRLCDFGLTERVPEHPKTFRWVLPFSEAGFLTSTRLQDRIFALHVFSLVSSIRRTMPQELGREFGGIRLTLSGAVACCHLLGMGGLRAFIEGKDNADALGTRASDYITLFANYQMPKEVLALQGLETYLKSPPVV